MRKLAAVLAVLIVMLAGEVVAAPQAVHADSCYTHVDGSFAFYGGTANVHLYAYGSGSGCETVQYEGYVTTASSISSRTMTGYLAGIRVWVCGYQQPTTYARSFQNSFYYDWYTPQYQYGGYGDCDLQADLDTGSGHLDQTVSANNNYGYNMPELHF